ncbi:MAG TPA: class I SAM-dependent methyltransferase [Thermoanaerobaculia bacterium]|nr:class I SAM-dependent methyltransferase [Thermoanaerobaculia bacterium]
MNRNEHNREQTDYFSAAVKPTMVPERTPYIERQIDEVVRYAGIQQGRRVLEVGCGMGRYTLGLASRGIAIEGLDLVPFLLAKLKEFAGERHIPLYCADVVEPPPELLGAFDTLIGFFALHHMHDLDACYRSMARLLKPGGSIVFLEPNAWNPLYYLQVLLTPGMTWKGDRGIVDMRRGRIFRAMRDAGLVDLDLRRFGFFPPQIYNRPFGRKLDHSIAGIRILNPVLPFQMFKGSAPR